jgi:hypothetical protein
MMDMVILLIMAYMVIMVYLLIYLKGTDISGHIALDVLLQELIAYRSYMWTIKLNSEGSVDTISEQWHGTSRCIGGILLF